MTSTGKYIKDEDGNVISPIVDAESVYLTYDTANTNLGNQTQKSLKQNLEEDVVHRLGDQEICGCLNSYNETGYAAITKKRIVNDTTYFTKFGLGDGTASASIELHKDNTSNVVARIDLKEDGYLYNSTSGHGNKFLEDNQTMFATDKTNYYLMADSSSFTFNAINDKNTNNGLVFVWERYNKTNDCGYGYWYNSFFIPKTLYNAHKGAGHCMYMSENNFNYACCKYIYITNNSTSIRISGHNSNTASGTGSNGIKYDNSQFVLSYIIGV